MVGGQISKEQRFQCGLGRAGVLCGVCAPVARAVVPGLAAADGGARVFSLAGPLAGHLGPQLRGRRRLHGRRVVLDCLGDLHADLVGLVLRLLDRCAAAAAAAARSPLASLCGCHLDDFLCGARRRSLASR